MPNAVALTHVPFEDLGSLAGVLAERGYAVQTLDACTADLQQLDPVAAQTACNVSQNGVTVFELDRERCAGKHLFDGPEKLERSFF